MSVSQAFEKIQQIPHNSTDWQSTHNGPHVVTAITRRDNTMATVLTAIVFVFIVCHTPKAALNLYEVGTVESQLQCIYMYIVCR